MKISEYIEALRAIAAEHGDLEVDTSSYGMRITALPPYIAYRKILTKREIIDEFWSPYTAQANENKGEKVCKV